MKKVGILGGTFNPPHIGHLIMANEVYHALELDEVRFMPNSIAPHKKMETHCTDENRLRMVELLIAPYEEFTVETIELERGGISYTYDTMVALVEREPETKFFFIIGGDMIDSLHSWYNIDELVKLVQFVGIKRPGTKSQSPYPVWMIEAPEINLSSTFIRDRIASGGTLRFLIPDEVEAYIRKEGLYGAK